MDDAKKHKYIAWSDFLSYLTRAFTSEEAHHFERKVDKSSFDFEAVEGLEPFAGASINHDIENLKVKIRNRNSLLHGTRARKRSVPSRNIAALAIVLLIAVILSVLLFMGGDEANIHPKTNVAATDLPSATNDIGLHPVEGDSVLVDKIQQNLQQKNIEFKGEVICTITFENNVPVSWQSDATLEHEVEQAIFSCIKTGVRWTLKNEQNVPDGIYTYKIEL